MNHNEENKECDLNSNGSFMLNAPRCSCPVPSLAEKPVGKDICCEKCEKRDEKGDHIPCLCHAVGGVSTKRFCDVCHKKIGESGKIYIAGTICRCPEPKTPQEKPMEECCEKCFELLPNGMIAECRFNKNCPCHKKPEPQKRMPNVAGPFVALERMLKRQLDPPQQNKADWEEWKNKVFSWCNRYDYDKDNLHSLFLIFTQTILSERKAEREEIEKKWLKNFKDASTTVEIIEKQARKALLGEIKEWVGKNRFQKNQNYVVFVSDLLTLLESKKG